MKTRILVSVLIILIFGICTQNIIADDFDWPRWRGPNSDGISMETDWNPKALSEKPKILWKTNVWKGFSNVAIKDNYIYTMGQQGEEDIVYCLNVETGKEVWRYSYESRFYAYGTQPTPIIEKKYVYVLSTEGILMC